MSWSSCCRFSLALVAAPDFTMCNVPPIKATEKVDSSANTLVGFGRLLLGGLASFCWRAVLLQHRWCATICHTCQNSPARPIRSGQLRSSKVRLDTELSPVKVVDKVCNAVVGLSQLTQQLLVQLAQLQWQPASSPLLPGQTLTTSHRADQP